MPSPTSLLDDITQVDGPSGMNSDNYLLQILGVGKEEPRLYLKLAIVACKAAGLSPRVRTVQL